MANKNDHMQESFGISWQTFGADKVIKQAKEISDELKKAGKTANEVFGNISDSASDVVGSLSKVTDKMEGVADSAKGISKATDSVGDISSNIDKATQSMNNFADASRRATESAITSRRQARQMANTFRNLQRRGKKVGRDNYATTVYNDFVKSGMGREEALKKTGEIDSMTKDDIDLLTKSNKELLQSIRTTYERMYKKVADQGLQNVTATMYKTFAKRANLYMSRGGKLDASDEDFMKIVGKSKAFNQGNINTFLSNAKAYESQLGVFTSGMETIRQFREAVSDTAPILSKVQAAVSDVRQAAAGAFTLVGESEKKGKKTTTSTSSARSNSTKIKAQVLNNLAGTNDYAQQVYEAFQKIGLSADDAREKISTLNSAGKKNLEQLSMSADQVLNSMKSAYESAYGMAAKNGGKIDQKYLVALAKKANLYEFKGGKLDSSDQRFKDIMSSASGFDPETFNKMISKGNVDQSTLGIFSKGMPLIKEFQNLAEVGLDISPIMKKNEEAAQQASAVIIEGIQTVAKTAKKTNGNGNGKNSIFTDEQLQALINQRAELRKQLDNANKKGVFADSDEKKNKTAENIYRYRAINNVLGRKRNMNTDQLLEDTGHTQEEANKEVRALEAKIKDVEAENSWISKLMNDQAERAAKNEREQKFETIKYNAKNNPEQKSKLEKADAYNKLLEKIQEREETRQKILKKQNPTQKELNEQVNNKLNEQFDKVIQQTDQFYENYQERIDQLDGLDKQQLMQKWLQHINEKINYKTNIGGSGDTESKRKQIRSKQNARRQALIDAMYDAGWDQNEIWEKYTGEGDFTYADSELSKSIIQIQRENEDVYEDQMDDLNKKLGSINEKAIKSVTDKMTKALESKKELEANFAGIDTSEDIDKLDDYQKKLKSVIGDIDDARSALAANPYSKDRILATEQGKEFSNIDAFYSDLVSKRDKLPNRKKEIEKNTNIKHYTDVYSKQIDELNKNYSLAPIQDGKSVQQYAKNVENAAEALAKFVSVSSRMSGNQLVMQNDDLGKIYSSASKSANEYRENLINLATALDKETQSEVAQAKTEEEANAIRQKSKQTFQTIKDTLSATSGMKFGSQKDAYQNIIDYMDTLNGNAPDQNMLNGLQALYKNTDKKLGIKDAYDLIIGQKDTIKAMANIDEGKEGTSEEEINRAKESYQNALMVIKRFGSMFNLDVNDATKAVDLYNTISEKNFGSKQLYTEQISKMQGQFARAKQSKGYSAFLDDQNFNAQNFKDIALIGNQITKLRGVKLPFASLKRSISDFVEETGYQKGLDQSATDFGELDTIIKQIDDRIDALSKRSSYLEKLKGMKFPKKDMRSKFPDQFKKAKEAIEQQQKQALEFANSVMGENPNRSNLQMSLLSRKNSLSTSRKNLNMMKDYLSATNGSKQERQAFLFQNPGITVEKIQELLNAIQREEQNYKEDNSFMKALRSGRISFDKYGEYRKNLPKTQEKPSGQQSASHPASQPPETTLAIQGQTKEIDKQNDALGENNERRDEVNNNPINPQPSGVEAENDQIDQQNTTLDENEQHREAVSNTPISGQTSEMQAENGQIQQQNTLLNQNKQHRERASNTPVSSDSSETQQQNQTISEQNQLLQHNSELRNESATAAPSTTADEKQARKPSEQKPKYRYKAANIQTDKDLYNQILNRRNQFLEEAFEGIKLPDESIQSLLPAKDIMGKSWKTMSDSKLISLLTESVQTKAQNGRTQDADRISKFLDSVKNIIETRGIRIDEKEAEDTNIYKTKSEGYGKAFNSYLMSKDQVKGFLNQGKKTSKFQYTTAEAGLDQEFYDAIIQKRNQMIEEAFDTKNIDDLIDPYWKTMTNRQLSDRVSDAVANSDYDDERGTLKKLQSVVADVTKNFSITSKAATDKRKLTEQIYGEKFSAYASGDQTQINKIRFNKGQQIINNAFSKYTAQFVDGLSTVDEIKEETSNLRNNFKQANETIAKLKEIIPEDAEFDAEKITSQLKSQFDSIGESLKKRKKQLEAANQKPPEEQVEQIAAEEKKAEAEKESQKKTEQIKKQQEQTAKEVLQTEKKTLEHVKEQEQAEQKAAVEKKAKAEKQNAEKNEQVQKEQQAASEQIVEAKKETAKAVQEKKQVEQQSAEESRKQAQEEKKATESIKAEKKTEQKPSFEKTLSEAKARGRNSIADMLDNMVLSGQADKRIWPAIDNAVGMNALTNDLLDSIGKVDFSEVQIGAQDLLIGAIDNMKRASHTRFGQEGSAIKQSIMDLYESIVDTIRDAAKFSEEDIATLKTNFDWGMTQKTDMDKFMSQAISDYLGQNYTISSSNKQKYDSQGDYAGRTKPSVTIIPSQKEGNKLITKPQTIGSYEEFIEAFLALSKDDFLKYLNRAGAQTSSQSGKAGHAQESVSQQALRRLTQGEAEYQKLLAKRDANVSTSAEDARLKILERQRAVLLESIKSSNELYANQAKTNKLALPTQNDFSDARQKSRARQFNNKVNTQKYKNQMYGMLSDQQRIAVNYAKGQIADFRSQQESIVGANPSTAATNTFNMQIEAAESILSGLIDKLALGKISLKEFYDAFNKKVESPFANISKIVDTSDLENAEGLLRGLLKEQSDAENNNIEFGNVQTSADGIKTLTALIVQGTGAVEKYTAALNTNNGVMTVFHNATISEEDQIKQLTAAYDQLHKAQMGKMTGRTGAETAEAQAKEDINYIQGLIKSRETSGKIGAGEADQMIARARADYDATAVDRVNQAYETLISTAKEYVMLKEKINNSSVTAEETQRYNQLTDAIKAANEAIQANGKNQKSQDLYASAVKEAEDRIEQANGLVKKYTGEIGDMKKNATFAQFSGFADQTIDKIREMADAFKQSDGSALDFEQSLKEVVADLKNVIGYVDTTSKEFKDNPIATMDAALKQKAMEMSGGKLKNSGINFQTKGNMRILTADWQDEKHNIHEVTLAVDELSQHMVQLGSSFQGVKTPFQKFTDEVKGKFKEMVSYAATFMGVQDLIQYGKEVYNTVKEFDDAFTEMRKVSDESSDSLKAFQQSSFDLAGSLGTTALQIQNSTADYMRFGQSLTEASESAKNANLLLNVSQYDDIQDATSALIAMSSAYSDLTQTEIIDQLNKVGKKIA